MEQKLIVQLHYDAKFIYGYRALESENWNSEIIFVGLEHLYLDFDYFTQYKKLHVNAIREIIGICNKADMVISFGLSNWQRIVILNINNDVKVIWRFFGNELYSKIPLEVVGSDSLKYVKFNKKKRGIRSFLVRVLLKVMFKSSDFTCLIKRIDYFQGISRIEYQYLIKHFELPEFLQNPILGSLVKFPIEQINPNPKRIIIGNNKSIFNNYLELIKYLGSNNNVTIDLLVNYGVDSAYFEEVKLKYSELGNVNFVTNMIEPEKFHLFFEEAGAYINNGYRQMSVGTIRYALCKGLKIYLSERNSYKDELVNRGFFIYSIENDLAVDLEAGNIFLTNDQIERNLRVFNRHLEMFSICEYQSSIERIMFGNT